MGFALGWPMIAAAKVRRERPLTDGATLGVAVGDTVSADQSVAMRSGRLGMGKPTPILAGLNGRVVGMVPGRGLTIEGSATVIAGIVGLGGSAVGPLVAVGQAQPPEGMQIPQGGVLAISSPLSPVLLKRAVNEGAVAVIAGGMPLADLEGVIHADLTAILDGLVSGATALPLALVLTQGLGAWAMDSDLYARLSEHAGEVALVDGSTDPRRGIRPEALLSQPHTTDIAELPADDRPIPGARVRVVGGRWQGVHGDVLQALPRPKRTESGLLLRCVQVRLRDGSSVAIPLNFLERVG